jgi:hypothetical protein
VDGQMEAIRWTARLLDLCACADVAAAEGQRNRGTTRPDAVRPVYASLTPGSRLPLRALGPCDPGSDA